MLFGRLEHGGTVTIGVEGDRLTFAVDNLTNRFYREQFQFAPARGRSFTVAVNVGGSR